MPRQTIAEYLAIHKPEINTALPKTTGRIVRKHKTRKEAKEAILEYKREYSRKRREAKKLEEAAKIVDIIQKIEHVKVENRKNRKNQRRENAGFDNFVQHLFGYEI